MSLVRVRQTLGCQIAEDAITKQNEFEVPDCGAE
jgi:hypothetical protein